MLEFLQNNWVELAGLLVIFIGVIVGIKWVAVSIFTGKAAPVIEKVGSGLQTAGTFAASFGLARIGSILKEGGDVADELGDVAELVSKHTADGNLTKEEVEKILQDPETKELVVAGKEFITVVIPKKPVN